MRRVVLSQPMYFPWVGMLEQIRLADVYIHYGDAQFSKGSFTNRVEVKTAEGPKWMTVPLKDHALGQTIDETRVDPARDWRRRHRELFARHYAGAPFVGDALALLDQVLGVEDSVLGGSIGAVARASMEAVGTYFSLWDGKEVASSTELGVAGKGSERVLALVRAAGGDVYITGHGARNYLDHEHFERAGVAVEYMAYRRLPYPQLHGPFNPHVTALDLVANVGRGGREWICSGTIPWREFMRA